MSFESITLSQFGRQRIAHPWPSSSSKTPIYSRSIVLLVRRTAHISESDEWSRRGRASDKLSILCYNSRPQSLLVSVLSYWCDI